MKIPTLGFLQANALTRRLICIGSLVVAILCVGLTETGADKIADTQRDHGKRTLHIMDYGYALPIEITAIRNFHAAHWLRDLELEFKNISTKPIYEIYFHRCRNNGSGRKNGEIFRGTVRCFAGGSGTLNAN